MTIDQELILEVFKHSWDSPAKKRKVGALVYCTDTPHLNNNGAIVSMGYNRMFDCLHENCENKKGETFEPIIHAEEDAIVKFLKSDYYNLRFAREQHIAGVRWSHIFVTYSPCINCCKLIVHAGITSLYYYNQHKTNFTTCEVEDGFSPLDFLIHAGITVIRVDKFEEAENLIKKIENDK